MIRIGEAVSRDGLKYESERDFMVLDRGGFRTFAHCFFPSAFDLLTILFGCLLHVPSGTQSGSIFVYCTR